MTFTTLERRPVNLGSRNGVIMRIDITSYSTGGEALTPAALGLESASVLTLFAQPSEPAQNSDQVGYWDRANDKLLIDVASTGAEVASATDLGTWEILAIGD